jgi:hypothetical protein
MEQGLPDTMVKGAPIPLHKWPNISSESFIIIQGRGGKGTKGPKNKATLRYAK